MSINIGDVVGAGRWPLSTAHPDCWGEPLQGVVLNKADPKAWRGTHAFPGKVLPPASEVYSHVSRCEQEGLLLQEVPVLWECQDGSRVYWERVEKLRPYAQDYSEWEKARLEARQRS